MNFYKVILAGVLCVLFSACAKNKVQIKGHFNNSGGTQKVYLYFVNGEEIQSIDSTNVSGAGDFIFEAGIPEPSLLVIAYANKFYFLPAENGDKLKFEADATDKINMYTISGSSEVDALSSYNRLVADSEKQMHAITDTAEAELATSTDPKELIIKRAEAKIRLIKNTQDSLSYNFAMQHADMLAGVYAAERIDAEKYNTQLKKFVNKLPAKLTRLKYVQKFSDAITHNAALSIGSQAPDFSVPDVNGNAIHLSDFKGKYLLIDFWASWCQPCRKENPNLVKAYKTYKNKGLEILGISLDTDKETWLQAITADKLNWKHGSELKDFSAPTPRLYQITSIPSNFLLDKEGKIIAKNLRGEELEEALQQNIK